MQRVPEVLDCWFESGSMPYAQLHYPFENKAKFEKGFPADFIAEGMDQTRGWFYTLMVLSTSLFGKAPFQNVIVNGILLAEDGKKMSKSLKNYPDPSLVLETYGADALRLYSVNSPAVRGDNLRVSEAGMKEVVRQVLIPLWNVYSFFTVYANVDGYKPSTVLTASQNTLDRWLLSWIVHELFVKEALRRIFEFRRRTLLDIFKSTDLHREQQDAAAIKIDCGPQIGALEKLSYEQPLFLVFLRHSGCTFCRETLSRLRELRSRIEGAGLRIVLVHMSADQSAATFFARYGLSDLLRISDPERKLYQAFGLRRGTVSQLLGLKTWARALVSGALFTHGIGKIEGDSFQMPGSMVLHKGKVVYRHSPESAAEEADFDAGSVCGFGGDAAAN